MQSKTFLPSSFQNDEKWAQLLIRQRETLLWTLQAMLGSCVTCLPKCKPKSVLQSQRWSLPQGDPVIKAFKPLRPGLPRGHSKRLDSRLHSKGQRKGQANQGALYQTGGWTTSLPPSNFHITDGPSTQDNKKKKKHHRCCCGISTHRMATVRTSAGHVLSSPPHLATSTHTHSSSSKIKIMNNSYELRHCRVVVPCSVWQ